MRVGRVELDLGSYLTPKERKRVDRLGLFSVITAQARARGRRARGHRRQPRADRRHRRHRRRADGEHGGVLAADHRGGPGAAPTRRSSRTRSTTPPAARSRSSVGAVGVASTVTAGARGRRLGALPTRYDLAAADQADAVIAVAADSLTDTVVDGLPRPRPARTSARLRARRGRDRARARAARPGARRAARASTARCSATAIASDGLGRRALGPATARASSARCGARWRWPALEPGDVAAVWANAAGLALADEPERRAIERVFGDGARRPHAEGRARRADRRRRRAERRARAGGLAPRRRARARCWSTASSLGGTHFSLVLAPEAVGRR